MRIVLAGMVCLLLAGCGGAPGAESPSWQAQPGLWMITEGAGPAGLRSVTCYAGGDSGEVFGDSRPTSGLQGIQRRPGGWVGGADPRREGVVLGD